MTTAGTSSQVNTDQREHPLDHALARRLRTGNRLIQQLTAIGKMGFLHPVGQKAKVTDPAKPWARRVKGNAE